MCQKGFLKKVASKLRQEGQEVCAGYRWEQEKCLVGNKWLRRSRIHLQCRRPGLDAWVGKIPWRREWQSIPVSFLFFFFTPVFLPGESHEQRSLEGYSPWGRKESDDWVTNTHTETHTRDRRLLEEHTHTGEKSIKRSKRALSCLDWRKDWGGGEWQKRGKSGERDWCADHPCLCSRLLGKEVPWSDLLVLETFTTELWRAWREGAGGSIRRLLQKSRGETMVDRDCPYWRRRGADLRDP